MDPAPYFRVLLVLLAGLIWLGIVAFLRLGRKKSLFHLALVTVFSVYVFEVLDYTLFQFQSLLLLRYVMPGLILNGQAAGHDVNLVPLATLTAHDLDTSLLNVLLLVPFGFGLPFITNHRMRSTTVLGALFSVAIELTQLATGRLAGVTFRVADINDVIFNTVGAAAGYLLFLGFVGICRRASRRPPISENQIVRYIAERPQVRSTTSS